jgi:hypothetical protein
MPELSMNAAQLAASQLSTALKNRADVPREERKCYG